MDKTFLVVRDLPKSKEIMEALDKAKLGIKVALWVYLSDYEDWRLVLASPRFDKKGDIFDSIRRVNDAIDSVGVSQEDKPYLLILRMSDPTIRELRKTYAKYKDMEGHHIGSHLAGNRFIEEGIVYRIK